ncbi:MAG: MBOAT family protein [Pirellulales bacterium]|nr:MBOAT family protein [Pirellulales bacterium]
MLFNSYIFLFCFLPITYIVFWLLRSARARYVWLAVTGYIFYGYWDPRFCLLMGFSTLVSYLAGLGFLKYKSRNGRLACLIVPIAVDLALLGFFKYADFTVNSFKELFTLIGWHVSLPALNIILPIGISFYTFHTITYIVDGYRGAIRPTKNFFEFAAYVSLFSQLVAGPIVRFRQIEEDLESLGSADRYRWLPLGISFFIIGLVEKVVIADHLALFVDPALAKYDSLSTLGVWLAMLGYTFQLYFDFAGYSDMAIGLGYLFGLRIPQNFNSPYKALDPGDFWRRWHISLSTCLRDYLYIPLGGNRHGEWKLYRNLMITMLLGGLWHGASWTFVFWGFYHGALLALHHRCREAWAQLPKFVRWSCTFLLVVIGWVFFRASDFGMAAQLLHAMFLPTVGVVGENAVVFLCFLVFAAGWAILGPNASEWHSDFTWKPVYGFRYACLFGLCLAVIARGSSPFLYFQF